MAAESPVPWSGSPVRELRHVCRENWYCATIETARRTSFQHPTPTLPERTASTLPVPPPPPVQ